MSEAIQDAISALEDERTVLDQKIAVVREAVLAQLDAAIATLRGLGGGANRTPRKKASKPKPRAVKAKARTAPAPNTGRSGLAQARDQAIKAALKGGAKPTSALLAVLPKEPGQTDDQREAALRNALSRLRMRKAIASTDAGWTLV